MPSETHTVRVVRRREEAPGIVSFVLADITGTALPSFSAGAHVDVHLPNALVRQYSLFRTELPGTYGIAVLKEATSRGGSDYLHGSVADGSLLTIGKARNRFPLAPGATRSTLIAGGIGITPMLAMCDELDAGGANFSLFYSVRSSERAAFLERLRASAYGDHVHLRCDDGIAAPPFSAREAIAQPGTRQHLYVCGPAGFIDHVVGTAHELAWPSDSVHSERFTGNGSAAEYVAFEVVIASTGRRVRVGESESVVDALRKTGIEMPTSCEQGICGTCATRVIAGRPDHRDLYLMPEERERGDVFMPCCSRSMDSTLVLDL